MANEWAQSYRTIANAMKQTADTSAAEPFNPYLKGGVAGAKFNALGGTADYTGGVLNTYADAMKTYQNEVGRAAVAEKNRQNELMKSNAISSLQQEANLIANSDKLKTEAFTSLYGKQDSSGNTFTKDSVQEAVNYAIKVDNAIKSGLSLYDVQGLIKDTVDQHSLDPIVAQHLSEYAPKAYDLYASGNTYQTENLPSAPPAQPSFLSFLGNAATAGYNKIKSLL